MDYPTLNNKIGSFPGMSANIAQFIDSIIRVNKYDVIVEFGSGGSTLYYLKSLENYTSSVLFVSVDMNFNWYNTVLNKIREKYKDIVQLNEKYVQIPWSDQKLEQYFTIGDDSKWDYPPSLKRLPISQNSLADFIRKSSCVEGFPDYTFSKNRPFDASYFAKLSNNISFSYFLRYEVVNDQYGESPVKQDYIDAGLRYPILEKLKKSPNTPLKALFIVDGGPRLQIVNAILDLENKYHNFYPTIVQHDAVRKNTLSAFLRRPQAKYISGSNITLYGKQLYHDTLPSNKEDDSWIIFDKDKVTTGEEKAKKELWYYQKDSK